MLIECPHCEARVDAKKLASYSHDDEDFSHTTVFLSCPSCGEALLARKTQYPDGSEDNFRRLYPAMSSLSLLIPAPMRSSFMEAQNCLSAGSYLASVLMCRRTIEGLCHHHGAKTGLATGLKKLHQQKIIDDRLFEWAEALRRDGNLAAHDPDVRIMRPDAADLIQFTQAILEYVFVLHHRFEAFKARRAKTTQKKAAPTSLAN